MRFGPAQGVIVAALLLAGCGGAASGPVQPPVGPPVGFQPGPPPANATQAGEMPTTGSAAYVGIAQYSRGNLPGDPAARVDMTSHVHLTVNFAAPLTGSVSGSLTNFVAVDAATGAVTALSGSVALASDATHGLSGTGISVTGSGTLQDAAGPQPAVSAELSGGFLGSDAGWITGTMAVIYDQYGVPIPMTGTFVVN